MCQQDIVEHEDMINIPVSTENKLITRIKSAYCTAHRQSSDILANMAESKQFEKSYITDRCQRSFIYQKLIKKWCYHPLNRIWK